MRMQQVRGRRPFPCLGSPIQALKRSSLANIFCVVKAWRIRDRDAGTALVPIEVLSQGEF